MPLDLATKADLIRVAHIVADAARPETLRLFRQPALVADNKLDEGFDPVTEADRAAEQAMRDVLARERPTGSDLGPGPNRWHTWLHKRYSDMGRADLSR